MADDNLTDRPLDDLTDRPHLDEAAERHDNDTRERAADPTAFDQSLPGPARTWRELRRSSDRKIAGVCGGLGDYLGVDPVLLRLLFVAGAFMGGATIAMYAAAWVLVPDAQSPPSDATGGSSADRWTAADTAA